MSFWACGATLLWVSRLHTGKTWLARHHYVALLAGLVLNQILYTLNLPLGAGVWLWGFLGAASLVFLKSKDALPAFRLPKLSWGVLVPCAVFLLISFNIVAEPLFAWDGRTSWFFHGKIIYYAGSLLRAPWNLPSIDFSHVGYPKLVPFLAAQAAQIAGFWNEFLPKVSLWALFSIFTVGFAGLKIDRFWSALLFAGVTLSMGPFLWNGYMDSQLAIFCFLSVTYLWRASQSNDAMDATAALLSLSVMSQLKNEGFFYAVLTAFAALIVLRPRLRSFPLRALIFAALPWVLWHLLRVAFGIKNVLSAENVDQKLEIGTFFRSLFDLSVHAKICDWLFAHTDLRFVIPLVLLGALFSKTQLRSKALRQGFSLGVAAALLQLGLIYVLYLSMTFSLDYWIATSVTRIIQSAMAALFAGLACLHLKSDVVHN